MTVRNLEHISFDTIIECLSIAFNNYYVEMPTDVEYYRVRWSQAKVDLKLSYGMFDEESLVAVMINGIDHRYGNRIAYNTGTGVIPEYRGQNIVKQMYDYAIPQFKALGISKCLLEVITQNTKAIKAYERVGFNITRTLKCFSGNIDHTIKPIQVEKKHINLKTFESLPNQNLYSWDNHKNTVLLNSKYNYYEVRNETGLIGFFIIDKDKGYLPQFDVLSGNASSWNDLFSGIQSITKTFKTNNVDLRLSEKLKTLKAFGIENVIDHYEMELDI